MKKIIFRLQMDSIIGHKVKFKYDINNTPVEQRLELIKIRYIDDFPHERDNVSLHVYYSYQIVYLYGYITTYINIPLNYASKQYFYIDYLYYSSVINELNFIIFINKKYLIDLDYIGIKNSETVLSIKDNDPRYNKNTYKAFHAVIKIEYNDNK